MGTGAGGLVWSVRAQARRAKSGAVAWWRVAVGRDKRGAVMLCRSWPSIEPQAAVVEVGAAWGHVHGLLTDRAKVRAAMAAARRLRLVHVRGAAVLPLVAGGGGGSINRKGKRVSSRGGVSVRSTERARLAADWSARFAARGVEFGAVCVRPSSLHLLPVGAALVSGYAAGGLLGEVQAQRDLTLCAAMSRKLLASMRRDGKQPSNATGDDATGAGVLAVARWRAINGKFPARRVRGSVLAVAWRAVVRESSRDLLGDAVPLGEGAAADTLAGSALPLPCFSGDDSRHDKAVRLVYERARAARPAQLSARLDALAAAGGRGSRALVVSKVGHAAALLLGGASIDSAATSAGFKSRGAGRSFNRAGDALGQAVRRLGFGFRFNLRQGQAAAGLVSFRRVVAARGFVVLAQVEPRPVSSVSAIVRGWSFRPSAGLPVARGAVAGVEVKRLARLASDKARAADRKAKRARFAAVRAVRGAADKRAARRAARSAKLAGALVGVFVDNTPSGAAVRAARLLREWRGKVWGAV